MFGNEAGETALHGPFRVDLRSGQQPSRSRPGDASRDPPPPGRGRGDLDYDDDPTVNLLQERCAEVVGKEAGAFVPTGTMANQIGLRLHFSGPGHLVAAAAGLHVTSVEVMTAAALAGIAYRTVDAGARGWIDAEQAARLLEPDDFYDVEVGISFRGSTSGRRRRVMPLGELRGRRKGTNDEAVRFTSTGPDLQRGRRRRVGTGELGRRGRHVSSPLQGARRPDVVREGGGGHGA